MSGDITITLTELVDGVSVESTPQSITVYDGVFVDSGGGTGGAVSSVNSKTGVVVLTASDVGADAAGAAATAQVTAEAYTDTAIASEVTRADAAYDASGAAAAAQAAAEAYADGISGGSGTVDSVVQGSGVEVDDTDPANPIVSSPLAASAVQPADLGTAAAADTTDFDAAGAATTAQAAAEGYTDTAIASEVSRADGAYATAAQGGKADTAVQPAGLTKTAVGLGNVDNTADSAKTFTESQVTGLTTDLAAKVPTTRTVSAGTGLTGGGALSADRSFAADFGTGSGKVTQGNDSRLTDARTPTAHATTHAAGGTDPLALDASQVTRTTNAQTGTTYTLVLADASKFLTLTNSSAITLTVPPNSSVAFPVGTEIICAQLGAGQVTVAAGSGVTVNASPGLKVAAQYGTVALKKTASDVWLAFGRLAA